MHIVNVIFKIPWKRERERIRKRQEECALPLVRVPAAGGSAHRGAGEGWWQARRGVGVFIRAPPACSVATMESGSILQLGGLRGQDPKWGPGARGLEARCRTENGSRPTSRFCAPRHSSEY